MAAALKMRRWWLKKQICAWENDSFPQRSSELEAGATVIVPDSVFVLFVSCWLVCERAVTVGSRQLNGLLLCRFMCCG